jgi:hypothetical protein
VQGEPCSPSPYQGEGDTGGEGVGIASRAPRLGIRLARKVCRGARKGAAMAGKFPTEEEVLGYFTSLSNWGR